MALKINATQLVYNNGNIYYFTKDQYNGNDIFYIYTNFSTLTSLNKIVVYNTLNRDISNIQTTDVVNNIYLYRFWKDDKFAIFKRDIDQELTEKGSSFVPSNPGLSMITNLLKTGSNVINPQRLLVNDSFGPTIINANFLSPTFSI